MFSKICLRYFLLIVVVCAQAAIVNANKPAPSAPVTASLPDSVRDFRAVTPIKPIEVDPRSVAVRDVTAASRSYLGSNRRKVTVEVFVGPSQSAVYSIFSHRRNQIARSGGVVDRSSVGTDSQISEGMLMFVQGKALVVIRGDRQLERKDFETFASDFAAKLERGEDELPVLIKHLPEFESVRDRATYFVDPNDLRVFNSSPVFDVLNFDGGAEAVSADYGQAQMVIVEFTTPQHATEADKLITAQLEKLRGQNQPLPTAYRRVGNYGVFVFNAPSEAEALRLIGEVKYEQVTQWLGDSPYPFLEAQRRYTATTLGVLVSVVKASGLALLTCISVGGILGSLLFLRRRAQQKVADAYSDAGGMLRLNLDDMTAKTDPGRLIGTGTN